MIPCGKSELMLFDPTPIQSTMLSSSWVDFHTLNSTDGDGPLEFNIPAAQDEYLDLNDTTLYVRLKVQNSADTVVIAPVNLMLHSLFQDVTLKFNDTVVQGGDQLYGYKAIINSLLLFDKGTKDTQLRLAGYCKDRAGLFEDKSNSGFIERARWIAGGKELELMGGLHLDMMNQPRYILPGVGMHLRLTRAKSKFPLLCLDDASGISSKIVITEAILYVRRVKMMSSVIEGHEDGLTNHNAIYPIQHMRMETFTVSKGAQSISKENLFQGKMPKFIAIAMVENAAFNGSLNKNPFLFKHFNVNYVGLFREGESIPYRQPFEIMSSDRFVRPYMSMIQALEQFNRNENNGITLNDYMRGNTFFIFNLTPDLVCGSGCQQAYRNGNLRLDMKFASPLAASINVLVYGVFDASLEITKTRNIILDYY